MAFQDIPKIETSDKYLDFAFSKATSDADNMRKSISEKPTDKSRKIEIAKLDTISKTLDKHMTLIIKSFPSFDSLTEFYQELLVAYINVDDVKKALGSIGWAQAKVKTFTRENKQRLMRTTKPNEMNAIRRSYYGRISSIMKQMKKYLELLERTRKTLRKFPTVKSDMFTVSIAGFPNVGKSTLLGQLTPAKPEINDYAFTTKTLNLGYASYGIHKSQFIDTPGTLARKDKMNEVEMHAYLAIKYIANIIVYVFDLSEAAYTVDDQKKLLEQLKYFDKPIVCYLSKTDIIPRKVVSAFVKEFDNKRIPLYTSKEELNKVIPKMMKGY